MPNIQRWKWLIEYMFHKFFGSEAGIDNSYCVNSLLAVEIKDNLDINFLISDYNSKR